MTSKLAREIVEEVRTHLPVAQNIDHRVMSKAIDAKLQTVREAIKRAAGTPWKYQIDANVFAAALALLNVEDK